MRADPDVSQLGQFADHDRSMITARGTSTTRLGAMGARDRRLRRRIRAAL
ncbi:Hypothetical protein A7982_09281 [Minicystis rosea]|nr:Hypothetical protein A7982_09281 [Minicystis rosea]